MPWVRRGLGLIFLEDSLRFIRHILWMVEEKFSRTSSLAFSRLVVVALFPEGVGHDFLSCSTIHLPWLDRLIGLLPGMRQQVL
jgi:hypothetical protein